MTAVIHWVDLTRSAGVKADIFESVLVLGSVHQYLWMDFLIMDFLSLFLL